MEKADTFYIDMVLQEAIQHPREASSPFWRPDIPTRYLYHNNDNIIITLQVLNPRIEHHLGKRTYEDLMRVFEQVSACWR